MNTNNILYNETSTSNLFFTHNYTGKLYIDEIFVNYDGPQVFTCKNAFDNLYIFTYADYNENCDIYLGNNISYKRLDILKRRKDSLYNAIVSPEDGSNSILKIIINNDSNEHILEIVKSDLISNELLPDPAYFLDVQIDGLPEKVNINPEMAYRQRRNIAFISFENETHEKEIDALVLGSVLVDFQKAVTYCAYKSKSIHGRLPDNIKNDTALEATGLAAASFGIYLKSTEASDVFGNSLSAQSLMFLMNILCSSNCSDDLKLISNDINPKAVPPILRILRTLGNKKLNLVYELATTDRKFKMLSINFNSVENRIMCLSKNIEEPVETVISRGVLTAIDSDLKHFTFHIDGESRPVSGKVRFEISDPMTIKVRYEMTIEEKLIINELTDRDKIEYTLIDARELDET